MTGLLGTLGAAPVASAGDVITDAVAEVAKAFRYPVLLLAILALAAVVYELGRLAIEYYQRHEKQGKRPFSVVAEGLSQDARKADLNAINSSLGGYAHGSALTQAYKDVVTAENSGQARRAIIEYDLYVSRRLDRVRLLVRAGPALGLMGTLIPLAPALEALGRGNAEVLAEELRTAFAITVVGIAVGLIAFTAAVIRERIYGRDLADLDYLHGRLEGDYGKPDRKPLIEAAQKERAEIEKARAAARAAALEAAAKKEAAKQAAKQQALLKRKGKVGEPQVVDAKAAGEAKPAEAKPAESKPAAASSGAAEKPVEAKPAETSSPSGETAEADAGAQLDGAAADGKDAAGEDEPTVVT